MNEVGVRDPPDLNVGPASVANDAVNILTAASHSRSTVSARCGSPGGATTAQFRRLQREPYTRLNVC